MIYIHWGNNGGFVCVFNSEICGFQWQNEGLLYFEFVWDFKQTSDFPIIWWNLVNCGVTGFILKEERNIQNYMWVICTAFLFCFCFCSCLFLFFYSHLWISVKTDIWESSGCLKWTAWCKQVIQVETLPICAFCKIKELHLEVYQCQKNGVAKPFAKLPLCMETLALEK